MAWRAISTLHSHRASDGISLLYEAIDNLANGFVYRAPAGSIPTPTPSAPTLAVSPGGFMFHGSPSELAYDRTLLAVSGAFIAQGAAAVLQVGRDLAVVPGTFAVTGETVVLSVGHDLAESTGSFVETASAAVLAAARAIDTQPGSFALIGSTVSFDNQPALDVATGTFALTGSGVELAYNRIFDIASGSFAETGSIAAIDRATDLPIMSGSFALTGSNVTLAYNRMLAAASGSFVETGANATLTYTPSFTFIGTNNAGAANNQGPVNTSGSCTSPTGTQIGDLLVAYTFYGGSTSPPPLPSGWTNLGTSADGSIGNRIQYRVATGSDTFAWSSATLSMVIMNCYRGASLTPKTPVFAVGTSAAPTFSALTMVGVGAVVGFAVYTKAATIGAPSGMTERGSVISTGTNAAAALASFDTNLVVSSWTSENGSLSPSDFWVTGVVEIQT